MVCVAFFDSLDLVLVTSDGFFGRLLSEHDFVFGGLETLL
jgi:hypothetical protein